MAIDKVRPDGRVIGVDIIPAPPPYGVSTIQGNFLCPLVQDMLRDFVANPECGRPGEKPADKDHIDLERSKSEPPTVACAAAAAAAAATTPGDAGDESRGRHVDVVLSDMSEPWPPQQMAFSRSLTQPYRRMMNVSGVAFRDHAGSMVFPSPVPSPGAPCPFPRLPPRQFPSIARMASNDGGGAGPGRICVPRHCGSPFAISSVEATLCASSMLAPRTSCSNAG